MDVSETEKTEENVPKDGFGERIMENPLGLVLGGFAVGLVLGMVLPVTAFERERVGPLAGMLKNRVIDTGQEMFAKGRDAVQNATSSVFTSEREHDVTTQGSRFEKSD
mgnify:CR=1 FL=1